VAPAEIFSLAGQTSVGLSFEQPVECMESTAGGTRNLLEVIRYLQIPARLFSAGSSECFGDTREEPANETTALHPQSPYAVAKATAYWQVANYRKAYGMHACTGIMANHESPLRPDRFVTQKIVQGVRKIKRGEAERITLGNLEIWRDWGWAPEYTQAMHLMLQSDQPEDFLIASGRTTSLRDFVERAFAAAGLRSADHLELDVSMLRPNDVAYSAMNPSRIEQQLGWKAQTTIDQIVDKMYAEELF
jgi:GDPmannose 4,6-dehydratase